MAKITCTTSLIIVRSIPSRCRRHTIPDSQKGGIGLRGPGETILETDRRLLRIRMDQLKDRLEKSVKHVFKVVQHVKKPIFQRFLWLPYQCWEINAI